MAIIHASTSRAVYRSQPESPGWTAVTVGTEVYRRCVLQTRWFGLDDCLQHVVADATDGRVRAGDTVVVSEKVAILLSGRAVPAATVRPGALARTLARGVRPVGNSRGLSIPSKMQYVINKQGRCRILAAGIVGAVVRPVGGKGIFYRIAGALARDLDGMRPPYEALLLPPLPVPVAATMVGELETALDVGVAIVDINDRGGSVRAASERAVRPAVLKKVLADNPLGQGSASTPFGIVRLAFLGRG